MENAATKPTKGSKKHQIEVDFDKNEKNESNSLMLKIDPVARIIPIVIDYLIEFEIAEEKSVAEILQLDEKFVRQALYRLRDHGLINSEEINKEYFRQKYAEKLGLKHFNFESTGSSVVIPPSNLG